MIKTDIILPLEYNTEVLKSIISSSLPITVSEISEVSLLRRSLDLSDTRAPRYRATVAFSASSEKEAGLCKIRNRVSEYIFPEYCAPLWRGSFRPVVVGSGPAGLFAALVLAESGACPIVLERGMAVEDRERAVERFYSRRMLDTECNVQFGEGGAGTFSDGKLKVGAMDKYKMKVLREFISSGATEDIAYSDTAHLGTDRLPMIIRKLRDRIVELGGEVRFSAKMDDFIIRDERLAGVCYTKDNEQIVLDTKAVILATGHSARDTYVMLRHKGLRMLPKDFGIGLRIEHPREYINKLIYKEAEPQINDTASYHLVTHLSGGRSVYSFCMCPGGTVVGATSEHGGIVTNGMSSFSRMGNNSNAALLVSVTPEDFGSDDALSGIELQRRIERGAFALAGDYIAPCQRLDDFLSNSLHSLPNEVKPSYPCGTAIRKMDDVLPEYICGSLRSAMSDFDKWLPGYSYPEAVLTAPETRSTSPVRILRTELREAEGFSGIFPAGEGAGYSGGIVSSAVDGIRCAEALIEKYGKK